MVTRELVLDPMAKKPKRNDVPVKLDAEVARMAKIVAAYREIPLAEYLSEKLRALVQRDLEKHQREGKPPASCNGQD